MRTRKRKNREFTPHLSSLSMFQFRSAAPPTRAASMFNAKSLAATPHGACVLSMLAVIGAVVALKAWLRLANGIWIYFLRPGKDLKKLGENRTARGGSGVRSPGFDPLGIGEERPSRAVERGKDRKSAREREQQRQAPCFRETKTDSTTTATMRASDRIGTIFFPSFSLSFLPCSLAQYHSNSPSSTRQVGRRHGRHRRHWPRLRQRARQGR